MLRMVVTFRRLFALLLLVLLPYQAMAAEVAACESAMKGCPQMMAKGINCCDHDDNSDAPDMGCGSSLDCAPALVALLEEFGLLLPKLVPMPTACAAPKECRSFIPDKAPRPPCFFA